MPKHSYLRHLDRGWHLKNDGIEIIETAATIDAVTRAGFVLGVALLFWFFAFVATA